MATTNLSFSPLISTATTITTTDSPPLSSQNQPEPISQNSKPRLEVLKSCKSLQEIQKVHAHITKQGLIHQSTTLADLIAKYAQMGTPQSLYYAQKALNMFDNCKKQHIKDKTFTYVYNSLIKGYTLASLLEDALLVFVKMFVEGVELDNYTFPYILSVCAKGSRLLEGVQLHGMVLKCGLGNNLFVLNSLIHFYGECGEMDKGTKVFDKMIKRNVVSWTSLICGYSRRNRHKEAVDLFFKMAEEGVVPSEVTLVCAISACAKIGDMELGERVCSYVGRSREKVNTVMVNALVDMYMKCGAVDRAKRLFEECIERNLVLYNTIMSNLVQLGMGRDAFDVLEEMLQKGHKPDRVTMLSAISACAELGNAYHGRQCHGYVLRNGLSSWDSICNSLIDMYMKCGEKESACCVFDQMPDKTVVSWNSMIAGLIRNNDLDSAQRLFNEMPERDLVSWNTMINALVQASLFEEAIQLFRVMQNEGTRADKMTMASVASACGYLGALDLAKWTFNYIKKYGIQCDMKLSSALIDMFARCGDPRSAMTVFNGMKEKDVSAWTAAIGTAAMEGNGKRAIDLFDKMLDKGVRPDEMVFTKILTACSHSGLVEQGREIFKNMSNKYGISPQVVHYGCLVDLLGRAGLLDEALDLIKTMPVEPNAAIWRAFLAACRIHRDDRMAASAAEMISKSNQDDDDQSGIHVLLSNIYASAGKWSDVARVRLQMKETGIKKKVPGSSSIEVNGTVHEFTSEGESQLEKETSIISMMLDEMNCRLREAGHVPDLSNVLLDIDDCEKEILLSRHSEKQAIAFGLISASKGMPIRVVKNLRMCSDCHSFSKMVSKVYARDIVVRDNHRFHFFHQGFCSCGDFW